MRVRPSGPGSAGESAPVRTERPEHDQRVEEGRGPGGGDGGLGRGRGRRYGRHRVGGPAGPSTVGGVAPLREGGGPLGTAVAAGVPGPAPPLAPRPVDPRLAPRPQGVPPLTPWLTPASARKGGSESHGNRPRRAPSGAPGPVCQAVPRTQHSGLRVSKPRSGPCSGDRESPPADGCMEQAGGVTTGPQPLSVSCVSEVRPAVQNSWTKYGSTVIQPLPRAP